MANTSATGGGLVPSGGAITEDVELENVFNNMIKGMTDVDGSYVRPMWQSEMPNIPDETVNWIVFSATSWSNKFHPSVVHSPITEGKDILFKTDTVELSISAYGPRAGYYAELILAGVYIDQNREYLKQYNMNLVKTSNKRRVPELKKNKWLNRMDFSLVFSRAIKLEYPVLNILSSESSIDNAEYTQTVNS